MLSSPGVIDFTAATTLGIERLEIADVMGAIIPGHFIGPGRVTTVESIPYSTELTGRLPVTIVGQSMSLYATWEGPPGPSRHMCVAPIRATWWNSAVSRSPMSGLA